MKVDDKNDVHCGMDSYVIEKSPLRCWADITLAQANRRARKDGPHMEGQRRLSVSIMYGTAVAVCSDDAADLDDVDEAGSPRCA